MKLVVFGLISLLLNACSTPQLPVTAQSHEQAAQLQQHNRQLTSWDMVASTTLTTQDSSYSLTAYWQQNDDAYNLRFDAPFTTGVLRIKGNRNQAELTLENKKMIKGVNPEQLIKQVTPFNIPVTGLTQWVRGIPHKRSIYELNIQANGDTKRIRQDGWDIEYDDWEEVVIDAKAYRLPERIYLQQGDINIKISPSSWVAFEPVKTNPVFSDLDF